MTPKSAAAWIATVLILWPFQFFVYVPAVIIWRAAKLLVGFALRVGVVGILLLFLPVIGWLILLAWLLLRRPDHSDRWLRLEEHRQGIERRSLFKPWRLSATVPA